MNPEMKGAYANSGAPVSEGPVSVVVRSHNDMPTIAKTLEMLGRQTVAHELVSFDNSSSDGTLEEIEKYTNEIHSVPEGKYIPGKVLNEAMRVTDSRYVVFLNSDCIPVGENWLSHLLSGFSDPHVGAVFSRQIPRTDCHPLFVKDTEDTFGNGGKQEAWRHCFSMAASAVRRSLWESLPFNERIQYSEDIEWTWRARNLGFSVQYVPDSVVEHSHNYTLSETYWRQYGEGKAEAEIFDWTPWRRNWVRYSFLPFGRQVLSDLEFCARRNAFRAALASPVMRMMQLIGRRAGFNEGMKTCKAQP